MLYKKSMLLGTEVTEGVFNLGKLYQEQCHRYYKLGTHGSEVYLIYHTEERVFALGKLYHYQGLMH